MKNLRETIVYLVAALSWALFPVITFGLPPNAMAAQNHFLQSPVLTDTGASAAGFIFDNAGIFSDSKVRAWEKRAEVLAEKYGIGIYLVTTDSLRGADPRDWTIDYFRDKGLGIGSDRSGEILMICPGSRDMHIGGQGKAEQAFTNYGVDALLDDMKEPLGDDDWDGGGELFITESAAYLEQWQAGTPYGDDHPRPLVMTPASTVTGIGAAIGLGAVTAGGVMSVIKKKHNTLRMQSGAAHYVVPGSSQITQANDLLVNTYTTSVVIKQNPVSSAGGSSFSSGGWTGGSSKF